MEPLFGLAILSALGYGAYRLAQRGFVAADRRRRQEDLRRGNVRRQAEAARKRSQQLRFLNQKARTLQLALFHLGGAPDFRRAASLAAQAKDVPLAFRQRQFRRFRPAIVRHCQACLAAGSDAAAITASLGQLLSALGVASFEAEYICAEAEQRRQPLRPAAPPSYAARMGQLQREHDGRLSVLRALPGLDPDTRDQLLEAEEARFRQALDAAGSEAPIGEPPPVGRDTQGPEPPPALAV